MLRNVFASLLITVVTFTSVLAEDRPSLSVVHLTDPHWGNPTFEFKAWEEAWQDLNQIAPEMLVLTGDHADNRCLMPEFFRRTQEFLDDLQQRLEGKSYTLALTLGNNDLWPNYSTEPKVMDEVLERYESALGDRHYLDHLGNGVLPNPPQGTAWISINTQIFSTKNPYPGSEQQAKETFRWLADVLRQTPKDQTVYLLCHIAPVYDLWDEKLSWREPWVEATLDLLQESPHRIVILAGHFHRNEIQSLDLGEGRSIPVLVAGSMCRKYEYHSSWRHYKFSERGVSYDLNYPEHRDWQSNYALEDLFELETFQRMKDRLGTDTEKYKSYARDLYAHHSEWEVWSQHPSKRGWILALLTGGQLSPQVQGFLERWTPIGPLSRSVLLP